jgi:RNA polymerase sigma-70 factor (ECF subfamily)
VTAAISARGHRATDSDPRTRNSVAFCLPCAWFRATIRPVSGVEELERLYLQYSRNVYRRARELLGDGDAARDATQEVFMRIIDGGGKVPCDPTPTAWLHRVTTNLCLNRLRDRNRRREILTLEYRPQTTAAAVTEPRAIVLDILDRIPEDLQEVALYFFIDEMTYVEIAEVLGVSKRTVSNRLAAFRELVDRLFPDRRLAS